VEPDAINREKSKTITNAEKVIFDFIQRSPFKKIYSKSNS
jgi:hypothetical protein